MVAPARYFSWLAFKMAALAAGVAGLSTLALGVSVWGSLGSLLVVGGATYGSAWWMLHARLRTLHSLLKQVRAHQFDELGTSPSPRGDELDGLIWELHRTGQMLNREIDDMRRMESYRREFIGNVSHELKTPIFSIQGFAETLSDGALSDPKVNRTFLQKIIRNANRLDRLARDLSEIARLETGTMEIEMTCFDLGELVREVTETLRPKADDRDVSLRLPAEPETLPAVRGDRERIRQVLVNLIDNAIKYNESGGYVAVSAQRQGDAVQVSVQDNGVGIPERHLNRLTERFYRVDKSRARHQGGSGLGLSIVKHILNAHDAQLRVESTVGEGSTFTFVLPVA